MGFKKKKVKSWPLSCICACVTRMPFCVKARLIHVINRIHSQKTHCMRVHKFLHKFCIVIISLYRHRAMRTATKTGKSGFTMSLARLSGQKGWSSCSSASYQQKPQISQWTRKCLNFTTFHSLFLIFYYSSFENNRAGNWQRVKRMSKNSQLAPF